MSQITRKTLPAKLFRVVRIYALYVVIAAVVANPMMDAMLAKGASAADGCITSGAPCVDSGSIAGICTDTGTGGLYCETGFGEPIPTEPVPEIPALFVPLFLALSVASVYYVRRRQMVAYQRA